MTNPPSLELSPLDPSLAGTPANDTAPARSQRWTDANLLVATTVARVSACLQPQIHVALGLCADHPVIAGDSTTLAFALSGVLAALLRSVEADGEDATLRVSVTEAAERVRIIVALPDVPPLGIVRALASEGREGADPTVAHCRRLVESCGGTMALADAGGVLAFAIVLPRCPFGPEVRVLPPTALRSSVIQPTHARARAC